VSDEREERSPAVMAIEAHEELVQRVEAADAKIRTLSIITMVVAFFLAASYFSQILTPFVSRTRYVQVDLLDPTLIIFQILLLALTSVWVYIGVTNYLFAVRSRRQIREIRALEKEMEKRITE
jgi:hypothetical protein